VLRRRESVRNLVLWGGVLCRDLSGLRRWGRRAPRAHQRIWLDPATCRQRLITTLDGVRSGSVLDGDWDLDAGPVEEVPRIEFCRLHWEEGVPWSSTGVYEYLLDRIERSGNALYGCRTRAELVARYEHLDRVFDTVRREGRLRTRSEMDPHALRERGGILMHLDRSGQPLFGKEGCHRLAMARVLGLPAVPAEIGVVHAAALDTWRDAYSDETRAAGAGLPRQP
jgi:hypothetical protein